MANPIAAGFYSVAVLAGMLLLLEIGRRIGLKRIARDPKAGKGLGTLKGTVFGLTSLILAFSFSGALSRYDYRRQLIVQESNAIGTAYLRVDLLPAESQPAMRDMFRAYADSRIEVYRRLPDVAAAREELARSQELQNKIWAAAVVACRGGSSPAVPMLVLTSLNEMIDITSTRTLAAISHPPSVIFVMIFLLLLASALIGGVDMATFKGTAWPNQLAFALILALTAWVIMEIEFPRMGVIRLDAFDQILVDARQAMQ